MISIKTHHANGQPKTMAEMIAELEAIQAERAKTAPCRYPAPPVYTGEWREPDWERYMKGACTIHDHSKPPSP